MCLHPAVPSHSSLQLLFHLIIDHLADFVAPPDVFSMFAEQLKKTYFNILIKPEKLGKSVVSLLFSPDISPLSESGQ